VLGSLFGDRNLRQEVAELRAQCQHLLAENERVNQKLAAVEAERDRLREQVQALKKDNQNLRAKLEKAERAQKRPDAPFRRPEREAEPKKPGRKKGHEAATRAVPQEVDEDIEVPLQTCPCCGGQDLADIEDLEPQGVIDVPEPVRPTVRRYRNQSGYCQTCRKRVVSRHKDQPSTARGAAGVQVGPRTMALALDLKHRVGIPFRKVVGVLELLLKMRLSPGALVRIGQRVADRCEPTLTALVQTVRQADVVHADETGGYIVFEKDKAWLWVFTSPEPKVTLYVIRLSRGIEVPLEVLGPEFLGTLGIDGWAGYLNRPYDKGPCIGHLLRRCRSLLEVNKQGAARFPHQVKQVLLEAVQTKRLPPVLAKEDYLALVEQAHGPMAALLEGRVEHPLNRKFLKHLRTHQQELFTFLEVPGLTPSNNLAEREVRPAVIVRKISAGNRSLEGAFVHESLASISRTAERNGLHLAALLPDLLKSTDPNYVLPLLPTWQHRLRSDSS
jgi:transposase